MKDDTKFREYMLMLGEIFDREISNVTIDIYWITLEPYPDDQCIKAFVQLIQTARFLPKPSDFLEILGGRAENKSAFAWMQVTEAVRRIGPYESVMFSDPVIHCVIRAMGGWPYFQDCPTSEWKWRQKEFERFYQIMCGNGVDNPPTHLPGIFEMQDNDYAGEVKRVGFESIKKQAVVKHAEQLLAPTVAKIERARTRVSEGSSCERPHMGLAMTREPGVAPQFCERS
jgi:hypothetical protein